MIYQLPYQKHLAIRVLQNTNTEGFICDIRKAKKPRSLNQNAYYFGVVCKQFAIESGYTPNEAHQELAREFLSYEKNGKMFVRSTTELSTIEFENYLTECRNLAEKHYNCVIPLPNEVTEDYINQLEGYRFE